MKEKLTQQYLKECVTYNPDTGIFTWNTRPLSHFKNSHCCNAWNARWANKYTGSISDEGYFLVKVNHKTYKAHRIAFLYMEGYFPENQVDHIDRNKLNNKWDNLREVSNQCNQQNCNISKNNTSGVCGVSFNKRSGKWVVRIGVLWQRLCIGSFENFEDAVMARYKEELNNPSWVCSTESTAYKYLKDNNLI